MMFWIFFVLMLLGIGIERLRPAAPNTWHGVAFNLGYLVLAAPLQAAVTVVATGAVMITNALGGGRIELPSTGWSVLPAVAVFVLAMDCGEYLFHRAQHRFAPLWALHSLHHSDENLSVSTTSRHFWLESALKSVTVYFVVGLLFRANPTVLTWYGVIMLSNLFFHMNIKIGWQRGWAWLNSPQYHRVHHSSLLVHKDKNFAGLFPLFDMLGGTAYRPGREEYPPTGLYDHDTPTHLLEALVWPIRSSYRKLFTKGRARE